MRNSLSLNEIKNCSTRFHLILAISASALLPMSVEAQGTAPLSCSVAIANPADGCDVNGDPSGLCGLARQLSQSYWQITCDVVEDNVRIDDLVVNRGKCSPFSTQDGTSHFNHADLMKKSVQTRADLMNTVMMKIGTVLANKEYKEVDEYFAMKAFTDPNLESDKADIHDAMKLIAGILREVIYQKPNQYPEIKDAIDQIMTIPLPDSSGSFSDLLISSTSYPDTLLAVADYLDNQSDYFGVRKYGDRLSFAVPQCDRILEYSFTVNGAEWNWKNY
jgi:hypothetical protein